MPRPSEFKVCLITGATSGIGFQSAQALAGMGFTVVVTGRNSRSGEEAVTAIRQQTGNDRVFFIAGDLSVLSGIRAVASRFQEEFSRLDVLIHNAGYAGDNRILTEDGFETGFAVNVVAPYRLTVLLEPVLNETAGSRVICLTGGSHTAGIDVNNLQSELGFFGLTTYSQNKLIMMEVMRAYLTHRPGNRFTLNICYPGQASTQMTRKVSARMFPVWARPFFPVFRFLVREDNGKSAAKASKSTLFLAVSDTVEGKSGLYLDPKCRQVPFAAGGNDPRLLPAVWALLDEPAG